MKILVVDDSAKMQKMICEMFGNDSAKEIITCQDSTQALTYYATYQPNIVLMDIAMPGVDGITVTRQIKQLFPDAKILVVTNYNDPHYRQAAGQAGAIGFVPKDDLLQIREYIKEL